MRTILFRFVLPLLLAAVCFAVGYFIGKKREHLSVYRNWSKTDIHHYAQMYRFLKDGDTNRLQKAIQDPMVLYVAYYDRHFGSETVTDQWFIDDLTLAHALQSDYRAGWVEWNRTNVAQQVEAPNERR
jgi:hypothetical protein